MALKNIIGQDRALRILLGTLKRDRVPTAMLLSGDAGIGKRLAAVNYAKALNCLEPVDFDCCDRCISCKKIDSETHPDVSIMAPENDVIVIEEIRRVEETLSLKTYEGKKKVVIIDAAETMNIYAANAFLKTLEEPPQDSLIMLVSSNPDRLPDTIRSRCTQVRFYPLPFDGCRKLISEQTDADAKVTALMLKLSMGRPGLGLAMDFAKEKEYFERLLENMIHGESKDTWADKAAIRSWLDMAGVFLRDIVVTRITGKETDVLLDKRFEVKGKRLDINDILDAYQSLQQVSGLLDFNLNKSITWNYVSSIMRTLMAHGS